jgi:SAM-dependent methyltransferase
MKPRLLARSCCTTPTAMGFWAAMFVLIYGIGLLLRSVSPVIEPFADTVILVALAAACVINFSHHRSLHCGITGPLFVLGAMAAGLIEAGAWQFDMAIVWAVVLLGVGLAFVIEWRTLGRPRDSNTMCRKSQSLEEQASRHSVDTVLTTWTLCSIRDVGRALNEVRRVLKPSGKLLFVEHGRAPDAAVRRWQDRVTPLWRRVAGGCHLNRPVDHLIEQAGFSIEVLATGYMQGPRIMTFMYEGSARPK